MKTTLLPARKQDGNAIPRSGIGISDPTTITGAERAGHFTLSISAVAGDSEYELDGDHPSRGQTVNTPTLSVSIVNARTGEVIASFPPMVTPGRAAVQVANDARVFSSPAETRTQRALPEAIQVAWKATGNRAAFVFGVAGVLL